MHHLTNNDILTLHRNVLRVLEEVGLQIKHPKLLEALAGIGAKTDPANSRVQFPRAMVEEFLAGLPKVDWGARRPTLTVRASFFEGFYQDARTGALSNMDAQRVQEYFTVARALPNVDYAFITGCPWFGRREDEPLNERLFAWRMGSRYSGILYPKESAQRLLDLYQAYAQLQNRTVPEVFHGTVFLVSPLKFTAEESEQYVWWWEHGCPVEVLHMSTAGLTGPVTTAGLAVINVAEEIGLALLRKACYGRSALRLFVMVAPVDMRTMVRPYGSPEMCLEHRVIVGLARHYGVDCFLHTGLSDAKVPSHESGAQKALSALNGLLTGADAFLDAGLLGMDTVYSPLQMILDNELAGSLRRMLQPIECSEEAIGFEAIAEAGPGGLFTGLPHTSERFRGELWFPSIWSRNVVGAWQEAGAKSDLDLARERFEKIVAHPEPLQGLGAEAERALRRHVKLEEA